MYKIVIYKRAVKQLKKIPNPFRKGILDAITKLSENPHEKSNVKKLTSYDHVYRLRVGDYRIKYLVNDNIFIIEIVDISHRKEAY